MDRLTLEYIRDMVQELANDTRETLHELSIATPNTSLSVGAALIAYQEVLTNINALLQEGE